MKRLVLVLAATACINPFAPDDDMAKTPANVASYPCYEVVVWTSWERGEMVTDSVTYRWAPELCYGK